MRVFDFYKYFIGGAVLPISFMLIFSCSKREEFRNIEISIDKNTPPMYLEDLGGNRYYPFMSNDSTIHIVVSPEVNLTNVKVVTSNYGDSIIDNGVLKKDDYVDLSDFTRPDSVFICEQNRKLTKRIVIYDLPVMIINTPDSMPIMSKEKRTEGCVVKIIDSTGEETNLGIAGIRGRGNSTWKQPKKPYNIKLDKKVSILGMNKSKHWILLANAYYDMTQIHNSVALEIARKADFSWVPDWRFVELILNGEHKGLYLLCEKIRVEKNKIEIDEIDVENWNGYFEGGYLLESTMTPGEIDNSFATTFFFYTGYKNRYKLGWEIKNPDGIIPSSLLDSIRNDLNYIEGLIYNEDSLKTGKYRDFFDIETAIDWFFVESVLNNDEASRSKNVYMYKTNRKALLKYGPPWDFDYGTFEIMGEENFNFLLNTALYFKKLQHDPFFVKRMKEKWFKYRDVWYEKIPEIIDEHYKKISRSAKRNYQMWPSWLFDELNIDGHVDAMKDSVIKHINNIDVRINQL